MPGPGAFLVGEEERREVEEILQSGYLSRYGSLDNPDFKRKVATLEEMFAGIIGVKHCLACLLYTSDAADEVVPV